MSKPAVKYELNEKDIDTVLGIMRKSNPDSTPEMAIDFLENAASAIHQMGHTDPEKLEKIYEELQDNHNYSEFYDPRLVAIYNTICALDGYEKFYIDLAKRISAKTIIDIGCGTGLLTCELAKQGHQMIGVEPSKLMLDVACKSPCGDQVKWIEGDALSLEEFNADLAIMTGHVAQFYLENEQWINALKSIYRALKPGRYLAFESRNPLVQPWVKKDQSKNTDWYAPNFHKTFYDPVEGEIEYRSKLLEVNGELVLSEGHYLFTKTGEELTSRGTLRFRTREEITKSLEEVGFSVESIYGNWDGSIFNKESPEMIFVATQK